MTPADYQYPIAQCDVQQERRAALESYQARRHQLKLNADRIRSPAAVSRKREYFKYPLETISDFAPIRVNFGARRPIADSQKPAIGGHF
jgi:hypothetical protein